MLTFAPLSLMHEIYGPGINRDVGSTEGGDDGSGSIEFDELEGHIAVVFEVRSDGKACGEFTFSDVNQHLDLFPGLFLRILSTVLR